MAWSLRLTQPRLLRPGSFRLLFLATLGSGVGTWLAVVALTVDVWDRTHSGPWVSALLMADFLPTIAVGLLLGPLVDRLSRRQLMIGADLARAAVFCALPFTGSPYGIVGLAAVSGVASGLFGPAARAALPNVVDDAELPAANALLQWATSVTNAAGPLAGGAIVAASGPHLAYWLNAATFLISIALLVQIRSAVLQTERSASRGHWRDIAEGFALVARSRALLTVMVAWSVVTVSNAGVNVAEVVLAKKVFNAGNFGFGLVSAGFGVGLAVGSLAAGSLLGRRPLAQVYGGGIFAMAVGIGLAAISPNVWVAFPCVVLAGIGNGTAVVSNALLVQRGAPDRLRGRVFAVVQSTNFAVLGLAMAAAGPLTDAYGARWIWGGAALAAAAGAAVGYGMARGVTTASVVGPAPTLLPESGPVAQPAGRGDSSTD